MLKSVTHHVSCVQSTTYRQSAPPHPPFVEGGGNSGASSEPKTLNSGFSLSITGSAGRLIASVLGIEPVNELVAQAYATGKLSPHIRTIIELGGEDSKLILLGESASGG